jgi:hypothetical protein
MNDLNGRYLTFTDTADKVNRLFNKRMETAQQRFKERAKKAYDDHLVPLLKTPVTPWDFYSQWVQYTPDSAQRWPQRLRKRGNNFIAHGTCRQTAAFHFQYEMLLDARP